MPNANLNKAKAAKNDEFYTVIADIEREMNAYYDRDPDVFRGKTILCPCDDPTWSNFTKHFTQNFVRYGLKKLICTGYHKGAKGMKYVLEGDTDGNGKVEETDIVASEMEGDGDFRSEEVQELLEEVDFIITNPPFSLFREFIAWIMKHGKKFAIIGTQNAVSCSEVFSLIKSNQVWLGATGNNTDMVFRVPEGAEIKPSDRAKAERMGYKGSYTRLGNSCWFTNIEHGKRHEFLDLCTKAQLKKRGVEFPKYDNYKAIEVSKGAYIPKDYKGVMGVPITWLDKYNPEQFEIVGLDEAHGTGNSNGLWTGGNKKATINGEDKYARLFIRHKPATEEVEA